MTIPSEFPPPNDSNETQGVPTIETPYGVTPPPPPPSTPAAGRGAPQPPAGGGSSRGLLIAAIAGAVVVVLLAVVLIAAVAARVSGGKAASVATATPLPPTATPKDTVLVTYTDPNGQFTIKYPSQWDVTVKAITVQGSAVNLTAFTPKGTKEGYLVAVGPTTLAVGNIADIVSDVNGTNYMLSSDPPITIQTKNGQQWQQVHATFTAAKGGKAGLVGDVAQHGSNGYIFIGFGPSTAFLNGTTDKVFDEVLNSMTFGS